MELIAIGVKTARIRSWFWGLNRARFPRRYWIATMQVIERRYDPLVRIAELKMDFTLRQRLWEQQVEECREPNDALVELEHKELMYRAHRLHVNMCGQLMPTLGRSSFGRSILLPESYYDLRARVKEVEKEVRLEERAKAELWIKILTLILTGITGIIGAAIGLVSVANKH